MKQLKIVGNNIGNGISQLGLGAMRMAPDRAAGIAAIHTALDNGVNFLNTGDFYSAGISETIVGEALKGRKREEAFVSVKFGAIQTIEGGMSGFDVRPELVENYLAYSLKRLGLDYIDLYQPCRINPHIPVEETIGAVSRLVEKGYVRTIGISEVDADTLRRANATHPISLVEVAYSLMNRKIEDNIIPTARELGIGIVGFSVLLSGILGGSAPEQKLSALSHFAPASALENINQNLSLTDKLQQIADEKGATLAQLAIAWVLAQGEDIMALVGSRTKSQFEDSLRATDILLSKDDLNRIENIIPKANALSNYMPPINIDKNGLFKH
tara:strand:- start:1122 stop:2102 length:981 start_codon:yes stop_codon:yes gene_type:complete